MEITDNLNIFPIYDPVKQKNIIKTIIGDWEQDE